MELVPCIEMLFKTEHPDFVERVRAAKAAGFRAVDIHLWRDKTMDALVDALAETGVRVASFAAEPRASLVDPAERAALLGAVRDAVPVARRLAGARVILASGFTRAGVPDATQRGDAVGSLREAARIAEDGGASLLLEPVNMVIGGQPMYVRTIRHGLDLVEEVGSPALRLLADVYHSAVSGETFDEAFADRMPLVGYVQVADVDGRHEPGTGRLDWPRLMHLLRARGYAGDIGLEYLPSMPIAASLDCARRALGLSPPA